MKLMLPGGTGKPSREGIERVTETMPITFALPMIVFLFVQGVFDVVNELAPGIPLHEISGPPGGVSPDPGNI